MEVERGLFLVLRPEDHLSNASLLPHGCKRWVSKKPQVLHSLSGTFLVAWQHSQLGFVTLRLGRASFWY